MDNSIFVTPGHFTYICIVEFKCNFMDTPDFGPFDKRFRDFSKPWYNDHAFALCINAIESLIGENTTDFFNRSDKKRPFKAMR